jgi:hypothetical protein
LELTAVAIMFLWSFDFGRYRKAMQEGAPKAAGPARALVSIFGYYDIGMGLVYSCGAVSQSWSGGPKNGVFASQKETEELREISVEGDVGPKERGVEE